MRYLFNCWDILYIFDWFKLLNATLTSKLTFGNSFKHFLFSLCFFPSSSSYIFICWWILFNTRWSCKILLSWKLDIWTRRWMISTFISTGINRQLVAIRFDSILLSFSLINLSDVNLVVYSWISFISSLNWLSIFIFIFLGRCNIELFKAIWYFLFFLLIRSNLLFANSHLMLLRLCIQKYLRI